MRNFPKTISNKNDVTNLLAEYPEETKSYLQGLIDSDQVWLMTNKMDNADEGIADDTHKVEVTYEKDEAGNDTDVVAEKYQYEFMSDPNGEIFRLGYSSVAEVEALV
mgnify:FL=1